MAPQASSALTMIRPVSVPAVIYIPEVHSGFNGDQSYFPELKRSDTSKAAIVADIASAQHEELRRVIAVDLANGTCWDASSEIAADVLEALRQDYDEVPRWARGFLEDHLGIAHVNLAEREWHEAA